MKSNDISYIKRVVRKTVDKSLEEAAYEIGFEIESKFERCVDEFYKDYPNPKYNRTHSTYLASSGYNNLTELAQRDGDTYRAGIRVDSSFIEDNPYRADTSWVFDRTWRRGIHGWVYYTKLEGKGNPTQIPDSLFRGLINMAYHHPPMSPSPLSLMNEEFKAINKKKYVNNKFAKTFENNLSKL